MASTRWNGFIYRTHKDAYYGILSYSGGHLGSQSVVQTTKKSPADGIITTKH